MREVARSIVERDHKRLTQRATSRGCIKEHSWPVARNKGKWDVAVTERGKARKFRTKNRRSDGQRSTDDDIRAEEL
jgi:hypothetical protein